LICCKGDHARIQYLHSGILGALHGALQALPDDPAILQGIIGQLNAQLAQSERERAEQAALLERPNQRIDQVREYIELLRRKRFGPRADRMPDSQLCRFDETALEALIGELEAALPAGTQTAAAGTPHSAPSPKRKPVRRPLPSHLPRLARIRDLPAAEKAALGEDWVFIGYDRSEQLAVIPRQT
jgi:hypothetical protein